MARGVTCGLPDEAVLAHSPAQRERSLPWRPRLTCALERGLDHL